MSTAVGVSTPAALALALAGSTSSLDRTFGSGGKVLTRFAGSAASLTVQADGRILMAGGNTLARYAPNGRLDGTFGVAGHVVPRSVGAGVVVTTGDKILVGGSARLPGALERSGFALARYDRRGRLDRGFGGNGVVVTAFENVREVAMTALRLERGGRLFAAGRASGERIAMARYTADGRLDPTFGNAGTLVADFVRGGGLKTVALGRDGSIVAAGYASKDFALVRLRADGGRNRGFGDDGVVSIDFGAEDFAGAAGIAADGKVVTFGSRIECVGSDPYDQECTYVGVGARLAPDGRLDHGFGRGGRVSLGRRFADAELDALALTAGGAIAVAGNINRLGKTDLISHLLLAVYRKDGRLDRRLPPAGVTETDFTNRGFTRSGDANAVAWDRKGRIVAAGDAAGQIVLARFRLRRR